ncbi:MAG TPA: AAA family ATPase [Polyangiaceae bacterium]|nr:AAA family ATPase [Polyangiaceae bacterium]
MHFEFAGFVFDEPAFELRRGSTLIKADPKVLDVLSYLLRRPGRLVTKQELVENVWGGRSLSDTVLTGAVSRLRKALDGGGPPELVENVYGRGYRFTAAVVQRESAPDCAAAPPPATVDPPSADAPFVGRAHAIERVETLVAQARNGRGHIVVVAGEPGIGKTHLAEVLSARATGRGVACAWGHCRANTLGPAFWPFVQALRTARAASLPAGVLDDVDRTLALLAPEGNPATDWGSEASRHRTFDSVARTLDALSSASPWMLVLDDLQWADAGSLRLLAYLAPEIARMRLVILATARDTEPAANAGDLAAVRGHRNAENIALRPLTEEDVDEYTAHSVGPVPPEVRRAVFTRSEGNPFFMVELLRPFSRSAPPRVDQLAVSGPALDIVRQRLRGLARPVLDVLSAAAVVGREFDLGLVAQITGRSPESVPDLLREPRDTRMIVESARGPDLFEFGHDLIRSVLLEGLSASEAASLHLRAADALERRHPAGDRPPRPDVVSHLMSALPFGDVDKTVRYAKRAARAAARVGAHVDAVALLRRALAALDLTDSWDARLRCDVLFSLALCERATSGPFAEPLAQAVSLGKEHGFGPVLAEAARHMTPGPGFVPLPGALEVLEAAERALSPADLALRADILARMSWTAPHCFDREAVTSLIDRAEALATESRSPGVLATVLAARFYFTSGPDGGDEVEALRHRIDRLHTESRHRYPSGWPSRALFSRIVSSLQRADWPAVDRLTEAFGALAREAKIVELDWHYRRALIVHRMNRGHFAGVADALKELHELAEGTYLFNVQRVGATDRGVLLRETGEAPPAGDDGPLHPQDSDCPFRAARKIRSLAEAGSIEAATAALQRWPRERLSELPHDRDYLATLVHLAAASVPTGCLPYAESVYALLAPYPRFFAADLSLHCDGSVSHFLGLLARALGRDARAREHLEQALDDNDRGGFPARAAHSAFELATLLLDAGAAPDETRARELLSRVVADGRRMGMHPLTRRAESRLRAG